MANRNVWTAGIKGRRGPIWPFLWRLNGAYLAGGWRFFFSLPFLGVGGEEKKTANAKRPPTSREIDRHYRFVTTSGRFVNGEKESERPAATTSTTTTSLGNQKKVMITCQKKNPHWPLPLFCPRVDQMNLGETREKNSVKPSTTQRVGTWEKKNSVQLGKRRRTRNA